VLHVFGSRKLTSQGQHFQRDNCNNNIRACDEYTYPLTKDGIWSCSLMLCLWSCVVTNVPRANLRQSDNVGQLHAGRTLSLRPAVRPSACPSLPPACMSFQHYAEYRIGVRIASPCLPRREHRTAGVLCRRRVLHRCWKHVTRRTSAVIHDTLKGKQPRLGCCMCACLFISDGVCIYVHV
jgi:hypothetical protein